MTDDRALLERAARAAGLPVPVQGAYEGCDDRGFWWDTSLGGDGTTLRRWNPLEDDGDALRLAVKLRLWVRDGECQDGGDVYAAEDGPDPYAATRRAIVRAAAAMGGEHG